jgi:hypothetical protein
VSVQTSCDRCKRRIGDVVYLLAAAPADNLADFSRTLTGIHHLHWDCVPLWGREAARPAITVLRGEFERLKAQYGRPGSMITQEHLNGFEAACEILEAGDE